MAYSNLKVTSGEVAANNVKSAPDRLQGTATENKNVFDKLVELFVGKYNDLLDELDDNEMSAVPPITINGYTISHANSGVTQGMYGTDQEQDPQHGEKFIVPYIIVDEHGHIVSAGNSEVQLPSGGGGGTSDYDDLTDKPSINSVILQGNKTSSDLSLASATHSHTKSEITDFPTLATVATTGDYDDLSDKPSIPTKTSDLNNDSLFLRGDTAGVYRGTSTTSGSTGTKSVTCSNFTISQLQIGVLVMVDFTHDNSASVDDLKLNVNATGAKPIRMMKNGNAEKLPAASFIKVIRTYPFYYDGDYWIMIVDSAPTKVSELTNDSGFITGYTETDPVFTASAAHGITSSDISDWNNKSDFSGDYDDLTNKPTIPTKVSDLTNDSGFSSVSFTRYTTSGTNIADIEIDGTTTKIYAPTSGGGGVTDYDQLTSRPQINSTTLTGNKSSSDLGLASASHNHGYVGSGGTVSSESAIGDGDKLVIIDSSDSNKIAKSSLTFDRSSATTKHNYLSAWGTWETAPTKVSDLTNDSGFITGYTETDPVFSASAASGITSSDISTWNGKSDFSGSYNDLTNKPTIPSKTSDLNNDSGFITTETDPTVPSWAKASTKPTYTASEVGALPDTTTIPANTSDLNNDSGFISADSSGNVSLSGSITAEGHDSPIGYRPTRATGSYSLASGTSWTTVPSSGLARTTLSQGVWIIQAQAIFASNSTGWRALRIYDVTTSEAIGRSGVTQPAVNGATTNLTTTAIISLTTSNAFTLQITQNSGAARNVDLTFDAVRIA